MYRLIRNAERYRYLRVHDQLFDHDRNQMVYEPTYGLLKLNTDECGEWIEINFENDTTGIINITATEISRAEWETMKEFKLFPILSARRHSSELHKNADTQETVELTFLRVHFRDY